MVLVWDLADKVLHSKLNKIVDVAVIFTKMLKDEFNKILRGLGIMLINNKIKVIINVISSLEKR